MSVLKREAYLETEIREQPLTTNVAKAEGFSGVFNFFLGYSLRFEVVVGE